MSIWNDPNIVGPLYFLAYGILVYAGGSLLMWWSDRRAAKAKADEHSKG